MDTSEAYIKMRRAAIPDLGMGISPSFYGFTECTWITEAVYIDHKGDFYYKDGCQLERQDQLQKMVFGISGDVQGQIWKIYEYVTPNRATFPDVDSMEQLLLGLVMKKNYNKVWNNEGWGFLPA